MHEANKSPERDSVVLHYCIDGRQQIAHALDVAKIAVILVVGQEHVLHLFEMDIRPDIGEWRVRIWMSNIFSFK